MIALPLVDRKNLMARWLNLGYSVMDINLGQWIDSRKMKMSGLCMD